jgi:hypothetical protein
MQFLGHTAEYWLELQQCLEEKPRWPELADLIEQNAVLRAKVSYYDQQIDRIMVYRREVSIQLE